MQKPRSKLKRGKAISSFDLICDVPSEARPKIETLANPFQDDAQDAWVRTLSAIKRRGETIDNAQTPDELRTLFDDDAGVVVQNYRNSVIDRLRREKGANNSPSKQAIAAVFSSIDQSVGSDDSWIELIEDNDAQVAFRSIEDMSELTSYLETLPEEHRVVIKRFIYAWALQEAGYEIPRSVLRRISRDRKKVNLPLKLRRGP